MTPRLALVTLGLLGLVALGLLVPGGGPPEAGPATHSPPRPSLAGGGTDPQAARSVELGAPQVAPSTTPPIRNESPNREERPETLLTGRFVDEEGHPVVDVRCTLEERRDRTIESQPDVLDWERPEPFRSGIDGRFAVRLWAPESFTWLLEVTPDRRAALCVRWSRLPPGTVDLGDVLLAEGLYVRGQVRTAAGEVPKQVFEMGLSRMDRGSRADGIPVPLRGSTIEVMGSGRFSSSLRVLPGTYSLRLPADLRFASGERVQRVQVFEAMEPLELVLRGDAPEHTIRGMVVDAAGAPQGNVSLRTLGTFGSATTTGPDGSFTLRRGPRDPNGADFPLQISGFRIDTTTTEATHSWGDQDVRLVTRAGVDLRLEVLREGTLQPVDHYAVHLERTDDDGTGFRAPPGEPLRRGHHPHGRVTLVGIARGNYTLRIVPDGDADLGETDARSITIQGDDPISLRVLLPTAVEQEVRVVDGAGRPVLNARVLLLCSPRGEPLQATTRILERGAYSSGPYAQVLDEARSDERGIAFLRANPQRTLALRVESDAQAPAFRAPIQVSATPIEVRLQAGATLRVIVDPPAFVDALRDAARDQWGERALAAMGPGFALRRQDGQRYVVFPTEGRGLVPFDETGGAMLSGIPPGTWDVVFQSGNTHELLAKGVTLRPGESRELRIDRSAEVPHPFRARVLLNGAAYSGPLAVFSALAPSAQNPSRSKSTHCEADADGMFEVAVPPGEQRVQLMLLLSGGRHSMVPSTSVFDSRSSSGDSPPTFEVTTGTMSVKLVDPQGNSVPGVTLSWVPATPEPWNTSLVHTVSDFEGRFVFHAAPGEYQSVLRIRSLMSEEDFQAHLRENPVSSPDEWTALRARITVPIGPIHLTPGDHGTEFELRLPPEWDR